MTIEAIINSPTYVSIGIEGYINTVFPQMVLRDSLDAILPESPVDFGAVGSDGQYTAVWTPTTAGHQSGYIVVYEDAAHTIRSARFDPLPVQLLVRVRDQDDDLKRILALLGENSRVVVSSYGPSGDPLASKVYIYDNAADAAADTNRTGEIDVLTLFNPSLPDVLVRKRVT